MSVTDLVADLLADDAPPEIKGDGNNRPKSPANRPAKILAALCESPQSPQSPGVACENEGSITYGDPLMARYRAWLGGIPEPRVLLTLDDAQVREAIAAGAVSREVAKANVLILVKVPKGDAGPGACGLLAVPRDRWADFSPTNALEALTWQH